MSPESAGPKHVPPDSGWEEVTHEHTGEMQHGQPVEAGLEVEYAQHLTPAHRGKQNRTGGKYKRASQPVEITTRPVREKIGQLVARYTDEQENEHANAHHHAEPENEPPSPRARRDRFRCDHGHEEQRIGPDSASRCAP